MPNPSIRATHRLIVLMLAALIVGLSSVACAMPVPARATATRDAVQQAARTPKVTRTPKAASEAKATRTPDDGLPTIAMAKLPAQARETIRLIEKGGPFPFNQDGAVFQNREGILPQKPRGYYQEYTVITPGSRDRGARRIVAGDGGELYYTADHYDSFKRVIP